MAELISVDGKIPSSPINATVTHVIFDMDGLLLDTEGFYTLVQEKIMARFGKTFDWSLKAKMMGKKAIESARIFVEESGLTGLLTPEDFLVEREDMLQELFPTCDLMPGVKRLINHLHANGIPMSVATGLYVTHVIFDMDGLLIDTEGFYTLVQEKIMARFGKTFDWSLKAKMMGKKAIESARIFVEESGLTGLLTPEDFLVEREDMLQELFPTCDLMPGVKRLISHLHANGIPMSVATGSHKRHFELKTQSHGEVFSMMDHVVMGDDPEVLKGKPSPDIFFAAAKRFKDNVDASKILVFEDAPTGIAAAKSAGMWAVMVPDARLDASYHKGADQVISSLLDFQPENWGLPSFQEKINLLIS